MSNVVKFTATLFAWFLFVTSGYVLISSELRSSNSTTFDESSLVTSKKYSGTAELTKMKGEQLVGMVPAALSGEFTLVIDGIPIDQNTDITTIDLRSVPGTTYQITLVRQDGQITAIKATH